MKLKLLFAPGLIVGTIILLIWFVYPAWSNSADEQNKGVKEKLTQLGIEEEKLSKMEEKNRNVQSLSAQLVDNKSKQDILLAYLPEKVNEEEIVDKLNYSASSLGLSVFDLSVEQPKAVAAKIAPVIEDGNGSSAVSQAVVPLPEKEDINVSFSVIGSYEKTKELLGMIYKLKRFNEVASLEISGQKAETGKENAAPADNLQSVMTLNFGLLKRVEKIGDPEGKVFSMSKFDMGTIGEIETAKTADVPEPLKTGEKGRANPFLP